MCTLKSASRRTNESTFSFCYEHDLEEVIAQANRRQFGIEIQAFYDPLLKNADELIERHQQALANFSGTISMHGAFLGLIPGSYDPLIREASAVRIRQSIGYAHELHASDIIFHHGYYARARFDDGYLARSAAFWKNMLAELTVGQAIHLENAHEISPDLQLALIDEVQDPRLGICLDIGHAHAFSSTQVLEWITALGERITYVHLHDNDGSSDQHLPLGQGNIPLVDVFSALETHAPQAIWMIEAEATASLAWLEEHGQIKMPQTNGERTHIP